MRVRARAAGAPRQWAQCSSSRPRKTGGLASYSDDGSGDECSSPASAQAVAALMQLTQTQEPARRSPSPRAAALPAPHWAAGATRAVSPCVRPAEAAASPPRPAAWSQVLYEAALTARRRRGGGDILSPPGAARSVRYGEVYGLLKDVGARADAVDAAQHGGAWRGCSPRSALQPDCVDFDEALFAAAVCGSSAPAPRSPSRAAAAPRRSPPRPPRWRSPPCSAPSSLRRRRSPDRGSRQHAADRASRHPTPDRASRQSSAGGVPRGAPPKAGQGTAAARSAPRAPRSSTRSESPRARQPQTDSGQLLTPVKHKPPRKGRTQSRSPSPQQPARKSSRQRSGVSRGPDVTSGNSSSSISFESASTGSVGRPSGRRTQVPRGSSSGSQPRVPPAPEPAAAPAAPAPAPAAPPTPKEAGDAEAQRLPPPALPPAPSTAPGKTPLATLLQRGGVVPALAAGSASSPPPGSPKQPSRPAVAPASPTFCAGDTVGLTEAAVRQYHLDGHDFASSVNAVSPGETGEVVKVYQDQGSWWVTVARITPDGMRQCDYPASDLRMASGASRSPGIPRASPKQSTASRSTAHRTPQCPVRGKSPAASSATPQDGRGKSPVMPRPDPYAPQQHQHQYHHQHHHQHSPHHQHHHQQLPYPHHQLHHHHHQHMYVQQQVPHGAYNKTAGAAPQGVVPAQLYQPQYHHHHHHQHHQPQAQRQPPQRAAAPGQTAGRGRAKKVARPRFDPQRGTAINY
eukprot:TRINITY_DN21065_c0_g1_i1.p1 TRINITY_DN21065_c0_g1~~TRINITY_DN21065_c0_g1_i1.p1  ORF type:complete len:741 (+),score=111.17 TRINITY_DN21065_c0_g1_i1:135-2357(+)